MTGRHKKPIRSYFLPSKKQIQDLKPSLDDTGHTKSFSARAVQPWGRSYINRKIDRQIANYNTEICRGLVLNKDILGLKGCGREKNGRRKMTGHRTLLIDFSVKLATHIRTECNKQYIYIYIYIYLLLLLLHM